MITVDRPPTRSSGRESRYSDSDFTPGNKVAFVGRYLHLTQEDWAEFVGVERGTIASYKARKNANPAPETIRKISGKLGIPVAWFYDLKEDSPLDIVPSFTHAIEAAKRLYPVVEQPNATFVRDANLDFAAASLKRGDEVLIPVWRGVMASPDGECEFFENDSPEFMAVPSFLASNDPDNHGVCIIAGSSMYPRVDQGEKVVIRFEKNPPVDSIVAALNPANGAIYLKALKRNDRMLELHSINEGFRPIVELSGWESKGFAVAIIHNYEHGKPNIEWDNGRPLRA